MKLSIFSYVYFPFLCKHVQAALEAANGRKHPEANARKNRGCLLVAVWMVKVIMLTAREEEKRLERELPWSERIRYHHEQNRGGNMNVKGTSGEVSDSNEEHVIRSGGIGSLL